VLPQVINGLVGLNDKDEKYQVLYRLSKSHNAHVVLSHFHEAWSSRQANILERPETIARGQKV